MKINKNACTQQQFWESGGVCPPEHLCEFGSAPLAQAFVSPRPRKAAAPLTASGGQRNGTIKRDKL